MVEVRGPGRIRFSLRTMLIAVACLFVGATFLRFVAGFYCTRIRILNNSATSAKVEVRCPSGSVRSYGVMAPHEARSRLFLDPGEGPIDLYVNGKWIGVNSYVTPGGREETIEFDDAGARVNWTLGADRQL